MRIPHRGYTRDRLRQTEARIAALVHPEVAAAGRLELSPPVGRIDRAAAQALDYRPSSAAPSSGRCSRRTGSA